MKNISKAILTIGLLFYLIVLTKLVLFKYLPTQEIINHFTFRTKSEVYGASHNVTPFKTIINYLFLTDDINFNIRVENLLGNIIGFVPFGFLLPLLSNKFNSLKNMFIATFSLSLTFELLQLVFKFGSFDVDDLILNSLGGVIGFLIIYMLVSFINFIKYKQKMKNI